MKKHKPLATLLSLLIVFNTVGVCYGEETSTGDTTVQDNNEEFHTFNSVIDENANNVPYYSSDIATYSEIPSSYQMDKNFFPDVRDQGSYGTCWAFAALGLSEFDLISKGFADKNIDLSELQLAYYTYNSAVDPLGGTAGDQNRYYNEYATTNYLNVGGTYQYAVRRLAQWSGAINESDVPYNSTSINNVLTNGLSDEYAYSKDVAHLQNAYVMSLKNNTDAVKRAIMEHGAVGVQYYHSYNCLLWNDSKQLWTYYDSEVTGGAHNVMIVGWDDNFSKDNFVGDNKPENDGAWLIRNSWGFTQSYFWMYYDNHSLSDSAWVFDMQKADDYDNNYQLDGGIDSYNVTDNICSYKTYSNVFTVQNSDDITSENLDAVSLSFTHVANVNYKIEIYTDLQNNNPYSGTKQEAATTEGTTTYAGYYTIPLNTSVNLKPGSKFAVVVTTDTYGLDYEQGIHWVVDPKDNNSATVWEASVSMANGKSYYGNNNYQWAWNWGNFCIKAFTTNNYKEENIEEADITLDSDFSIDNPSLTVTTGGRQLVKDVDYTVSTYSDDYGMTVTITGIGKYSGTVEKTFISVNNLNIKVKDTVYTGSEVTPEVTVTNDVGSTLALNTDYTVTYSNNVNASEEAIATIKGIGNYYGSVDVPFQIYNDIGANPKIFSLGLNGLIEFNFYFTLSDELIKDNGAYVLFTLPDGRQQKQYIKDATYKNGMYRFTCGVYAKEMTQKVKIQMINGEGKKGRKLSYSIEDYTDASFNSTSQTSINERALLKSMLNYGGYAQDDFNAYLDNKAYKNVKSEFENEMDSISADDLSDYAFKKLSSDENISPRIITLLLEESTSLRVYFNVNNEQSIKNYNVVVDGKKSELKKNSKGYYVEISSIPSNKLDVVHSIQVGNLSFECSALSYVYLAVKSVPDSNDGKVSKALYLYYLQSKAYFG